MVRPSPTCMKAIGEPSCGYCKLIVSGQSFFVGEAEKYHFNKKPWTQLRDESVLMPAVESYAPMSTYLINSCKQFSCDDDVTKWKVKLDSIKDTEDKLP